MNYYPFHIGDYAAHTRNLSLMEDLAYRRLLDAYYLAERPFIGSSADVARSIGMRDYMDAVEYVLKQFFEATEDGFLNKRADEEIAKCADKKSKAAAAGKASAQRRSNVRLTSVEKKATSVGKVATDVQPTNNQEPITNSVTEVTASVAGKTASDMDKDELWSAGKSLLTQAGMPARQCGSFVGKLVKDYGDMVVVDAVRAAVVARPADPAEYLKASCMRAKGERSAPNRQEAIERRNQSAVDAWLSQEGAIHA